MDGMTTPVGRGWLRLVEGGRLGQATWWAQMGGTAHRSEEAGRDTGRQALFVIETLL
jgi:hypothetical protein